MAETNYCVGHIPRCDVTTTKIWPNLSHCIVYHKERACFSYIWNIFNVGDDELICLRSFQCKIVTIKTLSVEGGEDDRWKHTRRTTGHQQVTDTGKPMTRTFLELARSYIPEWYNREKRKQDESSGGGRNGSFSAMYTYYKTQMQWFRWWELYVCLWQWGYTGSLRCYCAWMSYLYHDTEL